MTVQQGITSYFARVKQSALGSPGSTGSVKARRVTAGFKKAGDRYASQEIDSTQMAKGDKEGPTAVTGELNGELSPGTYQVEFENLLRKAAAATTPITSVALTISAATGGIHNLTRGTGSWLTDGLKIGDVIRLSVGTLDAANSAKNLLVTDITSATVCKVLPVNGAALTAEGPISGCTVTVVGKKIWTPTTGQLNEYLTWERAFSDLTKFDLYTDVKVTGVDIGIPATGIASVKFAFAGLTRTGAQSSATLTSPGSETTSNVLSAAQGKLIVNGAVTTITNLQIGLPGNIGLGEAEVGASSRSDLQRGKVGPATVSFNAKFTSTTLQALRDAGTSVVLAAVLADGTTAAADFVSIVLPAMTIFTDDDDDGDKEIIRSYSGTAGYNTAGGAALSSLATVMSIQDSQFA